MLRRILFISLLVVVTVSSLGELLSADRVSGFAQAQAEVNAGNEALLNSTVSVPKFRPN
jgi:hypothetical protein